MNNAKINSIETFLYSVLKRDTKKKSTINILNFGFPDYGHKSFVDDQSYIAQATPSFYIGKMADSIQYDAYYKSRNIDSMYLTVTPYPHSGTSGAPVFKKIEYHKKSWVEFAGVQSGKDTINNTGFVVKKELLINYINSNF